MSLQITIINSEVPNFYRVVNLPDVKLKNYRENPNALFDIAKSIIAEYKFIDGKYYRVMEGLNFYVEYQDIVMGEIIDDFTLHGDYEPETTKIVKEFVKQGDICVDAGASIGYFTLLMARLVSEKGKVYSFEPTLNQVEYLRKNIKVNGFNNVEVCPVGLWSKNGTINVNGNVAGRDNVKVVTLDLLNIPYLDFIKMDIDGSEPEALKGMIKTIERSPNLKMVIEYYPEYMKRLGNKPEDMIEILNKYFTYKKIEGDYGEGYWNYFCKRK